jgi:hypothetical protein
MLIAASVFLRRAPAATAYAAVNRAFSCRIPGFRVLPCDIAIGTLGAAIGARSVARHVAYL